METVAGNVEDVEWIAVEESSAAGRVRRSAMTLAERLGFSEHRVGEVGIVATELATNLHRHAQAGVVNIRVRRERGDSALELLMIDTGPGIADLSVVTVDGNSSRGTLGIGIGAAMRLSSFYDAQSTLGRGTVMVATFWRGTPPARSHVAAITRAIDGETVCGDAWAQRTHGAVTSILLADGLGHGELAAIASREAVRAFLSEGDESPAQSIRHLDGLLRHTRGVAAAVVRHDPVAGRLTFAGVGNIAVWVDDGERRHGFVSTPGIVGHNARKFRESDGPARRGDAIVLHSDGLSSKWDLNRYPGLRRSDALLIAAVLLRDAGIRHDDASVVVAKVS